MLAALEKSLGIVTTASKLAGINRTTHREWMLNDPEYARAVEEITIVVKDFGESKLLNRIQAEDTTAIIFFMKTRCRDRGYAEKVELVHSGIPQPPAPVTMIHKFTNDAVAPDKAKRKPKPGRTGQ